MKALVRSTAAVLCLLLALTALPAIPGFAAQERDESDDLAHIQDPEPAQDGSGEPDAPAFGEGENGEDGGERDAGAGDEETRSDGEEAPAARGAAARAGAYTDPEFPAAISRVFPDPAMAAEVRLRLRAESVDSEVTLAELQGIDRINPSGKVYSLDGVKFLTGVTMFQVYNSGFERFPEDTFTGMSEVTYISLYRGALTAIPPGAFKGLDKLEKLDFSDNQVERIASDAFEGCVSLDNLTFSQNQLTELPAGLFDDLVNLDLLWFWWNEITELDPDLFRHTVNMTRLEFNGNLIERLPDGIFDSMPRLNHLSLSSNLLESLPVDVFANQGAMLLNLNYNRIPDLSVLPDSVELIYDWTTYYTQYHAVRGYNSDPLRLPLAPDSVVIRSRTGAPNDVIANDGFDGAAFHLAQNPDKVVLRSADNTLQVEVEVEVYDTLRAWARTPDPLPTGAAFDLEMRTDVREGFTVTHSYSSQHGLVSVDADGVLTALSPGEDWITVVSRVNGSDVQTTTQVQVYVYAGGGTPPVKVSFDAQTDAVEPPAPVFVVPGEAYGALPAPGRDGYAFAGWHTLPSGGERVTADTVVSRTDAHTLYARWSAGGESGGSGGADGNSVKDLDRLFPLLPIEQDVAVAIPEQPIPATEPDQQNGNPATGTAPTAWLLGGAALCLALTAVFHRAGRGER